MASRTDTTRRTRQANLRERRRAAGLVNRNLWLTPDQAVAIDAYLKGGALPDTATAVTDTPRVSDIRQNFLNSLYAQIERLIEQRDGLQARVDELTRSVAIDAPPGIAIDPQAPVDSDAATSDDSRLAADPGPADEGDLLTQDEAAALLGVKQRMMQHWRKAGTGPAWQDHGGPGKAMYRRADVEAWARTWTKRRRGRAQQGSHPAAEADPAPKAC